MKQVEQLLQSVADIDCKDKNGQTALYIAAKKGDADVVALLLRPGANAGVAVLGRCPTSLGVLLALGRRSKMPVDSGNVDQMKGSDNPAIKRLLGTEGAFGEAIGLSNDWAYNIIKLVGNYGEVFERNVGPNTPLGIDRGLNALWSKRGLQYAPPIR